VVLDTPVAIQAGALIGHLGDYHSEGAERPEKKLHLETFSEQDMDVFLVASRAWAQRLPASERTWLKLAKGTAVMAHRDGASATRWPVPSKTDPVSDADLLIPKSLLEGLPAEDKFSVPATSSDRKALNWYRLDGLLHDAAGNLLNGWVREDVGDTPWVSPWDWEGYEVLHDYGRPIHAMASFMRSMRHFSEAQLDRYRSLADDEDQGPIRSRLFNIIDPNRDGQITADELQAALRLPAHAQAIAQMIIRKESEWFHRAHVWDVLDEMLGHSGSTPHLNWLAEKQRIKELSWWEEVADKVGLPSWGKAYHFHPVGLVGKFTSLDELKIIAGKITFCAEGNDNPTSMHYSRVIHWPGNDLSGVTLGRGYDMGSRTESEIFNHMIEAGVEDEKARRIAFAHGLKGFAARDFVANNKAVIGEITKRQQISLFNIIYPAYVDRTISIYNKWTQAEVDRVLWEDLGPVVKDVLVDFVYQGFTAGPNPMISGMRNSKTDMIFYIENTPAISQYEPGRQRANYLRVN
jgi:hypothetical protein